MSNLFANVCSSSKKCIYVCVCVVYNMPTIFYRLYHDDPVMNPLTPWERPPIKNVFCIYGAHLKTEV